MRNARRITATLALLALAVGGFAVPASAVAPVGTVTLTSPVDGVAVKGNPMLGWAAVAGAVKYRVEVSASASFTSFLYSADTAGLAATPTSDLPLGTIYWRVAATDGSTGTAGRGPFTATSFVRQPATQPTLLSPPDDNPSADPPVPALDYPATTPVLRWSPVPGVKNYRVELDDSPDLTTPTVTTTANTALALSAPLILGKEYYWRVQGISATAGVTTEYSETWRFTTAWPSLSGRPALLAPIGGVGEDVTELVFQWQPVDGARNYQIQVNSNPAFANNMTDDRVVMGTQYSPAATYNNATYYWRVRAQDTGTPTPHYGPWSDVGVFKRSWLPQPQPVSPIGPSDSQRFEWTPIARATYYELHVSTDPNFSTYTRCWTYGTSLTGTIYETLPSPLSNYPAIGRCSLSMTAGTQYYWRVRGIDDPAGINGVWSATSSVQYRFGAAPTLLLPEDNDVLSTPVLRWAPLTGYGRYRVTVYKPVGSVVVDTYATSYAPTFELKAGDSYRWTVAGLNSDGKLGLTTPERRFTAAAPDAGALALLADNGDQASAMPSMTWPEIPGADYYYVDYALSDAGPWASLSGTTKVYQPAYTYPTTVLPPGSYFTRVRGYSSTGSPVDDLVGGAFTVAEIGFASYVSPPNCVLPDCVAERPSTPELSWQPVAGAWRYQVYVALDKDFTNIVYAYETAENTLTPRESYLDNAAGQSYFWFVRPCKADGRCGEFGGSSLLGLEQAFRKKSAAAVLVSPADEAVVSDVAPFSWEDYRTSAPDGVGARQYKLQVATDAVFQDIVDEEIVDGTSYEAWASAYPDGVYYWRVQPLDGEQAGLTRSAVWQFTKNSTAPVPAPIDPEAVGLPTMRWPALPYASAYAVEVYTGTSGAFPSASKVLTATTKLAAYAPTSTLAAGWYSWRVRKLDPDGNPGPWSAGTPTFQVRQPVPTLVLPAPAASLATDDLLFSWEPIAGAASYRFESSTAAGFGTTNESIVTVMTKWAPVKAYADGVPYYWRVSVLDGSGNVMATSAARTLSKDSGRPAMSAATPATKLAADGTITVTFTEPVLGVSASSLTLVPATGSTTPLASTLTPAPNVASTTATITPTAPLIPGQFYDITAGLGITDAAGNAAIPTVKRVRVDQAFDSTSPALTERWDYDGNSKANGGGWFSARQAGATATFSFTGAGPLSIQGRRSTAGGYADVLVDGVKKQTVSFYNSTEQFRTTLYSTTIAGTGAHTVTVKVLGTRTAAAKDTYVDLDAFLFGSAVYQETDKAVRTTFARQASTSALGGSYERMAHEPDASGAEYRFSFRGTTMTWYATRMPNAGTAKVYVDGSLRSTTSLFNRATLYKSPVYTSAPVADGVHSVRIVVTGAVPTGSAGAYVTLDSITTH